MRERLLWQQIIIVEGVTEIPADTFMLCWNIKRVVFANTVIRIERNAFYHCRSLVYVKWSIKLEYIGRGAFYKCNLYSVFIPPSCRDIGNYAFGYNKNLSILHVPQNTELCRSVIPGTALVNSSPIEVKTNGWFDQGESNDMNTWIKNMTDDEAFSLHRACASFQPLKQVMYSIIEEKGLKAFKVKNSAGITPSQYLKENPYTELTEKEIIHDYIMKMIGEGE